ncbi:MAG: hypothetical protein Q4P17_11270 [Methanobacterium sp.]|nr:hypothetical protein [Methanobacterium sp.]
MNIFLSAPILVLTSLSFLLSLILFYNMLKYREAALSLIFNKLDESTMAFKLFAIGVLFFSLGRLLDLLNINSDLAVVDDTATLLNMVTTIIMIFVFYKLLNIIKMKNHEI